MIETNPETEERGPRIGSMIIGVLLAVLLGLVIFGALALLPDASAAGGCGGG
jgi:hypothetical protein